MNRREVLIGSMCAALSVGAFGSNRAASYLQPDPSLGHGCVISTDGGSSAAGQRTAIIVLGRCDVAIPEITRLGLSISTLAYFEGSTYGLNAEAGFAEAWAVERERVRKVENTLGFVEWVLENHDRVAMLGNFSAPFASRVLGLIAEKARRAKVAVFAIGAAPSAGAEGLVRTQRGLNSIADLRRIGCCVVTVPEVDLDLDDLCETASVAASTNSRVNDGSRYCRGLELTLNEVQYSAAAFENGLMSETFSGGNLVSLGWGYSDYGDAESATRMALNNVDALGSIGDKPARLLVTSASHEILDYLLIGTETLFAACGKRTPHCFASNAPCLPTDTTLQVTLVH